MCMTYIYRRKRTEKSKSVIVITYNNSIIYDRWWSGLIVGKKEKPNYKSRNLT